MRRGCQGTNNILSHIFISLNFIFTKNIKETYFQYSQGLSVKYFSVYLSLIFFTCAGTISNHELKQKIESLYSQSELTWSSSFDGQKLRHLSLGESKNHSLIRNIVARRIVWSFRQSQSEAFIRSLLLGSPRQPVAHGPVGEVEDSVGGNADGVGGHHPRASLRQSQIVTIGQTIILLR